MISSPKHDGKRLVADQMLGAEDGMSESEGFRLADVTEIGQIGNVPHLAQQLAFAVALEVFLQFDGAVEMIFDGALATTGDDDDVFDARGNGFLHRILNQRFVDQRQHFFRRSFCRGKKPRAEAGGGENGFSNLCSRHSGIVCDGINDVKKWTLAPRLLIRAKSALH